MDIHIQHFFDPETSTLSYIVFDHASKDAVIIDSVLNYDPASGNYSYESIESLINFAEEQGLYVHYIMDTHAHADHVSGMDVLKARIPTAKTVIGKHIVKVQTVFSNFFNLKNFPCDGSQFDVLADEEHSLQAGSLEIQIIFTPGHTPACASYIIGNNIFVGDALFMPDFGTGRCDFPEGSAHELYHSIAKKIYTLDEHINVYTGHDYMPGGRELAFTTTLAEQKQNNKHLKASTSEEEFISFRTNRDRELAAPKLLLPSIQINIAAGIFPEAEDNGTSYLKLPLIPKSS
ncbi:MAG: MBL fold metallo-hydrolase [Bdellovibrionales bacterium]|nr:MBL fold metallo-hydrolase [Bdellovibrionales bacterium]